MNENPLTKKFVFYLILLGLVLALSALTIERFQIPDVPPTGVARTWRP